MKYLAAYLLLVQGGNASPSALDITEILATVGVDADASRISALLADLEGKSVDELIQLGNSKMASMPSGGASASGASAGASAGAADAEEEEKAEEEKEESDDDMGFGLFD